MCTIILSWGGGLNGLGYGVDHLLPFSDKAKNNWMYVFTPPICPNGVEKYKFIINIAYILYVSVTSGHFVTTSVTLSRNTLLSKLGKGLVPRVHFGFLFFCMNRIRWERVSKAVYCCTFIW
jgi:hypothetical protein